MNTWKTDQLDRIARADELHIAPRRSDGTLRPPTTIWVVRDGDDLYVRSWRGVRGSWWRTAHDTHDGRISAGGVDANVSFSEVDDPGVNEQIDAAYRTKYGRHSSYVEPMVSDGAKATTLRLIPGR